jgi:hypothetical protein
VRTVDKKRSTNSRVDMAGNNKKNHRTQENHRTYLDITIFTATLLGPKEINKVTIYHEK